MARDKKLFKEFKEIHNDKGQRVGVVTYESWLEDKLNEARTKAVNKNALLADVVKRTCDTCYYKNERLYNVIDEKEVPLCDYDTVWIIEGNSDCPNYVKK